MVDGVRAGERIRTAAGDTGHGESFEPELIGGVFDVVRPIENGASRLAVGAAVTGAIEREDAHVDSLRRAMRDGSLEARAGKSVTVDNRAAAGIAVFRVTEVATAGES